MKPDAKFDLLLQKALEARENAYAPFSRFAVGAAILGKSGNIYTGCNIENSSYSLTICAERVALFKGISEGEKGFTAIAIVGDTDEPIPPCGACLQVLSEFQNDMTVIMATLEGSKKTKKLSELFPEPFRIKQNNP